MTTRVEFRTEQFQFSHGKKPRGEGYWAFGFSRSAELDDLFFSPFLTFAEAKKLAAEEARRRGVSEVWVQP